MLQSVLFALALIITGRALWARRRRWRHNWEHVLRVSLIMMAIGFVLCAPQTNHYTGPPLFAISHTAHMGDFLGHVCFIAATSALIYAVGYRLVTEDQITCLMRRVDRPAAIGVSLMLIAITLSRSTRTRSRADFFDVRPDMWLDIYWIAYGALLVYMLGYLIRLLLVLRRDPRSQVSAHLFLAAAAAGMLGIVVAVVNVLASLGILDAYIWALLSAPGALASFAAAWRLQAHLRARHR